MDRTLMRGMAETVATPLAKLVVNTARQVVVDPLQVGWLVGLLVAHDVRACDHDVQDTCCW